MSDPTTGLKMLALEQAQDAFNFEQECKRLTQQLAQARAEGAVLLEALEPMVRHLGKAYLQTLAPAATAFLSQLSQTKADNEALKEINRRVAGGLMDAETALSQAIARAERAEAALKPFAQIGGNIAADVSDQFAVKVPLDNFARTYRPPPGPTPDLRIPAISLIYVGDLRKAREALRPVTGESA